MVEDSNTSFRTRARSLTEPGELEWGTVKGKQWSEAVETSTNITVTDDGTVQSGSDIPSSVLSRYLFEDDTDSSVAVDAVGGNDAELSNTSYTSTAVVESFALSQDSQNATVTSLNPVDFVARGDSDAMSLAAWVYPRDAAPRVPIGWWTNKDNRFYVYHDGSGNWKFSHRVGDAGYVLTGSSVVTDTWTHVYIELTQSTATLKLNGDVDASYVHETDIRDLGAMKIRSGYGPYGNYGNHIVDDVYAMNDALTDSELQLIIDKGL